MSIYFVPCSMLWAKDIKINKTKENQDKISAYTDIITLIRESDNKKIELSKVL